MNRAKREAHKAARRALQTAVGATEHDCRAARYGFRGAFETFTDEQAPALIELYWQAYAAKAGAL